RLEVDVARRGGTAGGGGIGAPKPAESPVHVFDTLQVELDPTLLREPPVRANPRVAQRAGLIAVRQADPEIALLLAQGKAAEESVADEVAPPAEHRRDPHARPARDRLVEPLGRTRAA